MNTTKMDKDLVLIVLPDSTAKPKVKATQQELIDYYVTNLLVIAITIGLFVLVFLNFDLSTVVFGSILLLYFLPFLIHNCNP